MPFQFDATTVTAIAGLIVAIVSLINGISARRTIRAQGTDYFTKAGESVAKSADILLDPLNKRVDQLQTDLTLANETIAKMAKEQTEQARLQAEEAKTHQEFKEVVVRVVDGMWGGITVLVAQLEEAKMEPRYRPPKEPPLINLTKQKPPAPPA